MYSRSSARAQISQVVHVAAEGLVVGEILEVNLATLLLESSGLVKGVVVLGDLVAELTDGRNFDGSRPVGVHVTQGVGQILKVILGDIKVLVDWNEVMCRRDTTLSG